MIRPDQAASWEPPADWLRITTVDAHTEGEPLRVILGGYPALKGTRILERREDARARHDQLRTALMWEPRGHPDMYGCLIVPAERPDSDFGVLFLHNEGYSTMCGHGIIAVVTVLVQLGLIEANAPDPEVTIRIDAPAGQITASAHIEDGRVTSVRFRNVPSWVVSLDDRIAVPGQSTVRYDLAFGGAYYAYVNAADVGLTCTSIDYRRLIECGMQIKHAIMRSRTIEHPDDPALGFLYGTIFVGPPELPGSHSRNVCVFADGELDRSPTGTGVSGRLAIHHARAEIAVGESIVIESILGTSFSCRILEAANGIVIPEVQGRAFVTGRHEFLVDPRDPLGKGFLLR